MYGESVPFIKLILIWKFPNVQCASRFEVKHLKNYVEVSGHVKLTPGLAG